MNVREAINFGLNKLNFEDIRENQSKVVEVPMNVVPRSTMNTNGETEN